LAQIVTITVTQLVAPAPSTLQQTGAIISQGATTLASGTYGLITQTPDLTAILDGAIAITSLTWSSSVVTVVTTTPHGIPSGDSIKGTIAGAVPAGYNGTFFCTYVSSTSFTYPLASNPGSETTPGTFSLADVAELTTQYATYLAQGTNNSVYVLELGAGTPAQGVTALAAYISASPQFFYQYLIPKEWDVAAGLVTFLGTFSAPNAMTYFHITTSQANYTAYAGLKAAQCYIVNTAEAAGSFDAATLFAIELGVNPSSASPVAPFSNRYVYGVTPYPTVGNAALLATLQTANINFIGTGSQGGISYNVMTGGNTMDGNPFNYWFAADWTSINLKLNLTNAIINGSNSFPPLYYDQPGINRLVGVAQQVVDTGATFGLLLATPAFPLVVTATPFNTYIAQNPGAYAAGTYNGLSCTVTPKRGFTAIIFNLQISNFG
jgi:hypothetical protein